jgi:hypothetical protein
MKLRIKGNSIRLRLTRSEVADVAGKNWIESQTDFGMRAFRFAISSEEDAPGLTARFDDDAIVVVAPKTLVTDWAAGDEVGLYGEQPVSEGNLLSIAIEKDFRCLDRSRAEDEEADNYPHPAIKPRAA